MLEQSRIEESFAKPEKKMASHKDSFAQNSLKTVNNSVNRFVKHYFETMEGTSATDEMVKNN